MFEDLERNCSISGTGNVSFPNRVLTFGTMRYQAVFLYRLSARLGVLSPLLGFTVKQFNHFWTGADIAWQASIGPGLVLFHPTGVVIGPDVTIGTNCEMQQGVTIGGSGRKPHGEADSPSIGAGTKIGAGARLIGSIHVGLNVTVGANAVLIRDVPDNSIAVGVPAKVRPIS